MNKIAFKIVILLLFSFISCKKQEVSNIELNSEQNKSFHSWYYFLNGDFIKANEISSVPAVPFKAWTEAERISDISVQSSAFNENPKAYAVVNRVGILCFSSDEINLFKDSEIFLNGTQGNIVFYNDTPFFYSYQSDFFNTKKTSKLGHPFLFQFNTEQNMSYPVLSTENLGLTTASEVTDYIWNGKIWLFCIKDSGNGSEKINFSYLSVQGKTDIRTVNPENAENLIFITNAQENDFRSAKTPLDFSNSPERLKNLISSVPKNVSFSIKVKNASGHSPRYFQKNENAENTTSLNAYALLSDTWCASLFSDGSFYFNGALFENRILNHGKNIALKLPKLPAGFYYGDFAISKNYLYASWEESSFYKTARSGFICVDLNEILYKNKFNW